ncbi:MAG: hypothetical protein H0T76_27120 [Nannocystis sp.]|nr:hypothetical protein [Nannocystis sp.]MBA3550166.1 hypothetical protein [Nannocystis sp.]
MRAIDGLFHAITWLASTGDAAILTVLGLVLLALALGLWWRHASGRK